MADIPAPVIIETLRELKQFNFLYYIGIVKAKEQKKKLVYMNALGPLEIVHAFENLVAAYPENHAAAIQAKRQAVQTAEAAEGFGYTPDICSYARCDLGSALSGISPVGGMPKPDLLVYCSSQCWTIGKWWEAIARRSGVPYYVIDIPSQGRGMEVEPEQHAIAYVKRQLEGLIEFLEKHTGEKFDKERFDKVLRTSKASCELWRKIIEAGRNIPSPLTLFDQYVSMAPIVGQRGLDNALEFYQKLWAEIEDRVKKGIGSVPGEKIRLYWDGLPLWHNMKDLYNILAEKRAAVVANNYTIAWADLEVNPDNPFDSYAIKHLRFYDPQIKDRADDIIRYYHRYSLDGFLLHSDHSCRYLSFGLMGSRRRVQELTGVPVLLLDTDHGDPRLYVSENVKTQIHAYIETIEANRKRGSGEELPDPRRLLA